ncbi:MAG: cytochrome c [Nitrospinae bacterium]|nr:cytochrome c [Nitrospinota bacterium]
MKNYLVFFILLIITLYFVDIVFAAGKCPQPRKTRSAPVDISKIDKTTQASAENGKNLYIKTAKPMACKNCHGETGAGDGKLSKALKPAPTNFTCKDTMKDVSAGQMFWIIKNGSQRTGMLSFGLNMEDGEIWDVIKYIRGTFMK